MTALPAPGAKTYTAHATAIPAVQFNLATGGAFKTTIPGGGYAALAIKGSAADVVEGWTTLLRDWLPSSGLQLDARPCFEHYPIDAECDLQTGAFSCEICIPVVPL